MRIKLGNFFINLIIPISVAIFNLLIILYPKQILGASREGITLWFNNVFPSLLPFVVGSNILVGLGVVSFIGTLLQPVMYPIFRVPGCGAFAFVIGMTSGYPVGAKVTANLRESEAITREEAQRLASFCNNSGPLFILGAVAVSMFGSVNAGYFILLIHYLGAIITGLLFRNYKKTPYVKAPQKRNLFDLAVKNMIVARKRDGRAFGQLLGDSVRNAMETILLVGGFIILFCVIVEIFDITGINRIAVHLLAPIGHALHIGNDVLTGLFIGSIEVTNGVKILSEAERSKTIIILSASLISFGGLSILAQASGFLGKTDISIPIYILSKCIHALVTLVLGFIFAPFFSFEVVSQASNLHSQSIFDKFLYSSLYFLSALLFIAAIAILALIYKKVSRRLR